MRRTPPGTALLALAAVPLLASALAHAPVQAAEREDATWTEVYFRTPDGTTLHADVLRPAGLADDVATPVVLTVSPYTSHSGGASEPDLMAEPPSERFYDFLDLTGALDEGYTYVMVDLPGTGGSGGCNDWGGPAEQGAVEAAVEWAADQPWSTGRVALLGKSYDAWTGLMGVSRRPEGLAAVVAMEPVFSGYSYLYNRGVRFANSVGTPVVFQANDLFPGSLADSPDYQLTGAPLTPCHALNILQQQDDVEESSFWAERDLVQTSRGSRLPVLLTQGFLETNTKPDRAFDYWSGLRGSHNIGWFGQFDHVRGWETDPEGRPQVGRDPMVFARLVEAFLDKHLLGERGRSVRAARPGVQVQDNLGRWRREAVWPPSDVRSLHTVLETGSYADDGANTATGPDAGQGVWSVSAPLRRPAWIAGEPVLDISVTTTLPRANLVGLVYDIAPDGTATVISRGTQLVRDAGTTSYSLSLYGQDWRLARGHRIGVLLSGADAGWWVHTPTGSDVVVDEAAIRLPFLTRERRRFLDGESTPRLEEHLADTATVPAEVLDEPVRFRVARLR
ncbi:CocE/NonD family hydrolase [Nocardioides sp.]|uniref:CocE/NonD family hydrolase n=1 Tax=Nocardioides sp. TaxID=35761 RepID=UPI00260AA835|nr:CocE/NonD family hydrolase [Nocardioides sp.]